MSICLRCIYKPICQTGKEQPNKTLTVTKCSEFIQRESFTEADRIRYKTDEELAEWINDLFYGFLDNPGRCEECEFDSIDHCKQCWLEWLRKEAKDGQ